MLIKPKIVCIIQARMGSSRLPGKIALPVLGKPLLHRVLDRVFKSELIDEVVIATTTHKRDDETVLLVENYPNDVFLFRGSEEDVLDRYYKAAKERGAEIVVRITSDNPFIDPKLIDQVIGEFLSEPELDYVSTNIGEHTFPRGTDVEVVSFDALERVYNEATEEIDREHVTIHIKRFPEKFKTKGVKNDVDWSKYRLTVDESKDYELTIKLYEKLLGIGEDFCIKDIVKILNDDPMLFSINQHIDQQNNKY